MAETPEEWLVVLAKRLDAEYPRIARLRRYASGNADLPEMGKNLRESWKAFQKKARTDFGGLCVGALANRMRPNGITIGENSNKDALAAARRAWRDNRMDVQVADAIKDYLITSKGYLAIASDASGAVITRERPEQFIAAVDPIRDWKARATLKVWRDPDLGKDFAKVVIPGLAVLYSRQSTNANGVKFFGAAGSGGDQWARVSEQQFDGDVPCVVLAREDGQGLFEPHIDVIDRINLGKLQRLVTTALQAFRQRALKSDPKSGGVPETDEDGNDIDYRSMFEPSPGAMWDLPEGVDIWESQQTDIRPMLDGEKADARDFAAVSRTPVSVFTPESANQSAEGAAAAKEQHVALAEDEIARIKPALAVAMVYALRVEGFDLGTETLDVGFVPADRVSMAEKYAAAAAAKAAGESWDSIARNILGYSPDQIRQDALARAQEQLALLSLTQGVPNGGSNPGAAA